MKGKILIFDIYSEKYIFVNLKFSEGIKSITVNETKYTSSQMVKVPRTETLSWEVETVDDYELVGEASGEISTTGVARYTIQPVAKKIQIPVKITWEYGVESVTVNDIEYKLADLLDEGSFVKVEFPYFGIKTIDVTYEPIEVTLYLDKGTARWKANFIEGYSSTNKEGSLNLVDKNGNYAINLTASLLNIPVKFTIDSGVQSLIVNGTSYSSSTTVTVPYGSQVEWSVNLKAGYDLTGDSQVRGTIVAKEEAGHNVTVSTQIRRVPVRLMFNIGVKSITVEGNVYNASDLYDDNSKIEVEIDEKTISNVSMTYDPMELLIQANYGTVQWTAVAEEGYTLNSTSGNVSATGEVVNIQPTIKQ